MMKLALPILNKQDPIEINTEDGTVALYDYILDSLLKMWVSSIKAFR
jgi:hypothetical protein